MRVAYVLLSSAQTPSPEATEAAFAQIAPGSPGLVRLGDDGFTLESGDVLGHEFMGEVVEIGPGVTQLNVGDRVVVPFTISCGDCFFCKKGLYSCCDTSNPNAEMARKVMGQSPAGLFGYYPGGKEPHTSPKRQRVNSGGDQPCTRWRFGLVL